MNKDHLKEFREDVEFSDKLIENFERRIVERIKEPIDEIIKQTNQKQKDLEENIQKMKISILDMQKKNEEDISTSIAKFEKIISDEVGKSQGVITDYVTSAKEQNKKEIELVKTNFGQLESKLKEWDASLNIKCEDLDTKFSELENKFKQENAVSISQFENALKETKDQLENLQDQHKTNFNKKIKKICYSFSIIIFIIILLNIIIYIKL